MAEQQLARPARKGYYRDLDRQPAAQDKSLLVVRVGKKILLVGVSSQNITKLTELDEDDISAASSPSDQDFASALKSALGRRLGGRNWEQTDSQDGSNTGRYEDK